MKDSITIKHFFSKDITPLIPDLARLRITVFRDFPYLYEGSYEYEKEYLKVYTNSSASVLVAAFDRDNWHLHVPLYILISLSILIFLAIILITLRKIQNKARENEQKRLAFRILALA